MCMQPFTFCAQPQYIFNIPGYSLCYVVIGLYNTLAGIPTHYDELLPLQLQTGDDRLDLVLTKGSPLTSAQGARVYNVHMPSLSSEQSSTVVIETVFSHALVPFPREITQNEAQLVQFTGNVYLFTPYPSNTQSTVVKLPNDKIESFNRVTPTSSSGSEITYGPYPDVPPFSNSKLTAHYENNSPFIVVAELERIIEVSHWGNIAVEEHIHIKHIGKHVHIIRYVVQS